MLIRFARPWGIYQPGATTDAIPDGAATELIRRGIAVAVEVEVRPANTQPTNTRATQAGRRRV